MNGPKLILGICGSPQGRKSKCYELLVRALQGAEAHRNKPHTKALILAENFNVSMLKRELKQAHGLIVATPTHWFNVSVLTKRLIDEVFWDFSAKPWDLEDMALGVVANCNEDGGNQAIASVVMPLNHCGLLIPPFGTLFHNEGMPSHGEDGWQNELEEVGKQVATFMR